MSVLSIDIGTSHCTVIEGSIKKGVVEIIRVATGDLPPEQAIDGKNIAPAAASDVISELITKNKFKSKKATVTVNTGNMMLRDIHLPKAKPKQLAGMVRNEMIQNHLAASDDIMQFIVKPSSEKKAEGKSKKKDDVTEDIRAVAVKPETIESYHHAVKKLKLTPSIMDFHTNAVDKLVRGELYINKISMKDKAYLLVDFGSTGTLAHAVYDNGVYTSRYFPLGTKDLDGLVADREFLNHEQAKEYRLQTMNLLMEEEIPSGAMSAARNFLFQWNEQLQNLIRYFMPRKNITSLDGIFIFGIGSLIKGLPEYVTASSGVESSRCEEISKIRFKNANDEGQLFNCLNAAGAIFRLK